MKTIATSKSKNLALTAMLTMGLTVLLAGCDQSEQAADSPEIQTDADQPQGDEQPLGEEAEFDGFTVRASVSPTEQLPDAMAQQYGIEADPSLALLNVVVMENRPEGQPVTVSVDLSAHYESLTGQVTDIDMRAVEANDRISYIGTLDTRAQRVFQFFIKAQPEGTDQPLEMDFEVQLPELSEE